LVPIVKIFYTSTEAGREIVFPSLPYSVVTGVTAIRQFHILSAVYFDIPYPW